MLQLEFDNASGKELYNSFDKSDQVRLERLTQDYQASSGASSAEIWWGQTVHDVNRNVTWLQRDLSLGTDTVATQASDYTYQRAVERGELLVGVQRGSSKVAAYSLHAAAAAGTIRVIAPGSIAAAGTWAGNSAGVLYTGKNAAVAGVQTGVEYSVASALGQEYNAANGFARNFTINMATGWIPGLTASRTTTSVGQYAMHYGINVAANTTADTVWMVGVEGRDVGSSLMISAAGNLVGQGFGDALSVGMRRVFANVDVPLCFVAGTLVQRGSESSETPRFTPIDELQLGQRVEAKHPLPRSSGRAPAEPDVTWKALAFQSLDPQRSDFEVTLLRPAAWVSDHQAEVGAVIDVELSELNFAGTLRVVAMEDAPVIEQGPGKVITGAFRHLAGELAEVHVEGLDDPIRCTPKHPFWSLTRDEFVPAHELKPGEYLQASDGRAPIVKAIELSVASEAVYNIEVQGEHVYRVSGLGILVHNASFIRPGRDASIGDVRNLSNNWRANGRVLTHPEKHHAVFEMMLDSFDRAGFTPRGPTSAATFGAFKSPTRQRLIPIESNYHQDFLHGLWSIGNRDMSTRSRLANTMIDEGLTPTHVLNELKFFYRQTIDDSALRKQLIDEVRLIQRATGY